MRLPLSVATFVAFVGVAYWVWATYQAVTETLEEYGRIID